MSSTDSAMTPEYRSMLLTLARDSIRQGFETGRPLPVNPAQWPEGLQREGASFVTLKRPDGSLRGCIGTLEARQPLVTDVAEHAHAAAFRDPRFQPLAAHELEEVHLELSILSRPEPLPVASEAELLAALQPGEDGLILEDGVHRGTFLPAVWESLPEPVDFVRQLKRKAGLPSDYWSPSLTIKRYRTESFGEDER
ncbi:AMMECR1 domain-containing protein [Halovibrio salipaludis]|uniref:AMMECR1 domain-containing protein n=1 Tax=Halovibrio salipaludis TaxID=2032626 RepID=A0A2A2F6Q9_9GAMM|nr:AmmeMemoRadiSam system protein A [Halovibrio salipaludis]PAU80414.1 AMMECR1 domain-containing protein [Halovibrio salipaludis]